MMATSDIDTDSQIKPFYSNTNVLITGATGLFGKALIQKLLRSFDDIDGIYLLIREKRDKNVSKRLEELFSDAVFDTLKREVPNFLTKIHVIEGNLSKTGIDLSDQNRQLLIDKINIIFHCAAEMNMDAKLKAAIDTNIRGTTELLDLCQQMRNLKSMVYVSTAYSSCTGDVIEERLYDVPLTCGTLMKFAEELDANVLEDITKGLIGKLPNTYCFTKAISEDMVSKRGENLPIGIFRPSIVMPTYLDPVPGWTSNVYGPVGIMIGVGLGILRVFPVDINKKVDLVPADLCVNGLICAAWEIPQKKQAKPEIPIYNYSGGVNRNMKWGEFLEYSLDYKYPPKYAIWATFMYMVSNPWCVNFLWFFLHTIPGYLVDTYLILTGRIPRLTKAYKKISRLASVIRFFSTREWDIQSKNIESLWNRLGSTDQKLFLFDMDLVNHKTYMRNVCTGIKVYIMKEPLDNVEAEKKNYQRLLRIHYITKYTLIFTFLVLLYKFVSLFINIF